MDKLIAKIWIGCYATYNDGFLFDKQYEVESVDELEDALKDAEKHFLECIRKEKPQWDIEDHYCEEMYIADNEIEYNGEFLTRVKSECIGEIREILELNDESFNHDLALLFEASKVLGYDDLSELDDRLFSVEVDSNSDSDLGHAYAEITCLFDSFENAPETLINYFDYDSYGRDLYMEFTYIEVNGQGYAVNAN